MKKVYLKPTTDIVVLNLSEKITWGDPELVTASNDGAYTEGKENTGTNPTIDDEEDHLNAKFTWSVWGDDEEEEDN